MDRDSIERFRLMLFGRMIMGVAHDVDNHLSVVLGFAELIQLTADNEKKVREGADKILSAGERINRIVKEFSQYVRPHAPENGLFPVPEMLQEILLFSRYDLGRGNVTLSFPSSIPSALIDGDRRDIALILLCLLFNASEAMAETGGELKLEIDQDTSGWIFRVTDHGVGLTREVLMHAFEEGYTTKTLPSHTGMGLPVARALAAGAGGEILLSTGPGGKGCLATLLLPRR